MIDRASTFSDPEIVDLLRTKFVAVAYDAWYGNRRKDGEGEFYRKVVTQERSRRNVNSSTQGRYAFSADGTLFGFNNNHDVDRVKRLLRRALEQHRPAEASAPPAGKRDRDLDRTPPDGTVIVDVTSKVLGGYEKPEDKWAALFQQALGRDHLWISKDEASQISRGTLPEAVKIRLARFHLEDNTRGEPSFWEKPEIRRLDITLKDGRLDGSVRLETAAGDRGYDVQIVGFVSGKEGKLARFDVVAKGDYWGSSHLTSNAAPKGKFPLAIAFRLAAGQDEADRVPPQAARWLPGYMDPNR